MNRSDIWYHLFPLGLLGAEDRNPSPGIADGPVSHRLPDLLDWLDHLVQLGVTALSRSAPSSNRKRTAMTSSIRFASIDDWAANRTWSTSSKSVIVVRCKWGSMPFFTMSVAAILILSMCLSKVVIPPGATGSKSILTGRDTTDSATPTSKAMDNW